MKKRIIIGVAIIALIGLVIFLLRSCNEEMITYNTTHPQDGAIEITVTATGTLQPVDQVEVGTQVSGVIERIYVDFNSVVKKGELLAELDKLTLDEKVTQANATLTSSQSDLTYAQQNYDRVKQLYDLKAATQASLEEATNRLTNAQTSVQNAKANLHQAQVNLSYAYIYSPIDGVVLDRSVDEGQTVAASFNTPTLFTIARDLSKMQVEADVDEADIGQIKDGQSVTFTVDSYSEETFTGTVNQIRLSPTTTNNVVTYTVIIEAPNLDFKLLPGMTANVTILTEMERGLTVPMSALSFRPTEENQNNQGVNSGRGDTDRKPNAETVYVETSTGPVRKEIKTGLSDGVNVIVHEGLTQNDNVILSVVKMKKKEAGQAATNPLVPQRPDRGRR
ncbi:MAG: efflux RND transporter periplasmic adaptor subunit [Candidatus Azobacteroides sp.]|nr:efflux RND transporter periplasmic adaptor subunit [Candidatus Azobacteroides sp.]